MDLGMVSDGYHSIEHALPNAPVYADVRAFFSASPQQMGGPGTAYVPTLVVAYGGVTGDTWFYQNKSPLNDERLLRHMPRRVLDGMAWRWGLFVQEEDFNHQQVARDAAKIQQEGTLVALGAHGQMQGVGVHWELWGLGGPGAMAPHAALRAATLDGAKFLGLDHQLGSIEVGKLADLVVLESNPLDDIKNSTDIAFVVKNGEIFE